MPTPVTSSPSQTWVPPSNGIVGGYTGGDVNIERAMMAFAAIAWYNAIEVIFLTFFRFKRYKGLYFWSLMVTAWAIIVYMIGAWGKMVNMAAQTLITQTFCNIGWICMVGGNSLVLYSRLHIITQNFVALRLILCIILVNAFVMYIPTTALDYGCNVNPWNQGYCDGYSVMERIQMTLFTIQEFVISGFYLLEVYRYLKTTYRADLPTKKVMYELIAVNIALIVLDIALLSVEYENLYQIEVTLKGFVYSLKLKLELGVLSRLVDVVGGGANQRSSVVSFPAWTDKIAGGGSDHLEGIRKSRSSTATHTSNTVPWLVSFKTQQSPAEIGKHHSPIDMQFVTTAKIGEPLLTVDSSHDSAIGQDFPAQANGVETPAASLQKPIELSRQSSLSLHYPGRLNG